MNRLIPLTWSLLFISNIIFADQKFLVKDDQNHGVSSAIYFGSENNLQGSTDSSGSYTSKDSCKNNTFVIAKPISPFYESGKRRCANKQNEITVLVTYKPVYAALLKNREISIEKGNFGVAALASNEIAARTVDLKQAKYNKELAIIYFAKALNFEGDAIVFDPKQQTTVASPAFIKAVAKFQSQEGIVVSGTIDYRTLSKVSNETVGNIMFLQK